MEGRHDECESFGNMSKRKRLAKHGRESSNKRLYSRLIFQIYKKSNSRCHRPRWGSIIDNGFYNIHKEFSSSKYRGCFVAQAVRAVAPLYRRGRSLSSRMEFLSPHFTNPFKLLRPPGSGDFRGIDAIRGIYFISSFIVCHRLGFVFAIILTA